MSSDASSGTRVLVISGSTRRRSTNTALCRTAAAWAPDGITVECCAELAGLPPFDPDDDRDPLPEPVLALRASIAAADAVLFCTPEYAGTVPGTLKNLLDWTVGGTELNDKPVAWMNVAVDPQRGRGAHATLATVLGYVQAQVIGTACRHVPIPRDAVGPDGLVSDPSIRYQIQRALHAVLEPVSDTSIREVPSGPGRDPYLPLLHLADDSNEQVRGYYQQGTLFAHDAADGTPLGVILAIPEPDRTVELKAVAVDASMHGRGIGTRLLLAVLARLRATGADRVIVGTSSAGVGQLAYYQKAGFRLWKIERDFFSPERGYRAGGHENGIALRDMVWMDQPLGD